MTLSQKESMLLQELKTHEELCIEKYDKYSQEAHDGCLKNLFTDLSKVERGHLDTLNQMIGGTVPSMTASQGGGQSSSSSSSSSQSWQSGGGYSGSAEQKQADSYLCQDALSNEKHVSSLYDTCIFEFKTTEMRDALNHIQKEEQQHGEQIYQYMAQNGMYNG